jgi:IPT/TIG domain
VTTISGANFGANVAEISVDVDGNACTNVAILDPHHSIQCQVAPGTGGPYFVNVTVDGQTNTSLVFNYDGVLISTSIVT